MKFIERLKEFLGLDEDFDHSLPKDDMYIDGDLDKWRDLAIALHQENIGLSRLNAQYREQIHYLETTNRCQAELLHERG